MVPQRAAALDAGQGDGNLTLALERTGASGNQGIYANRIELQNITPRFPLPDFSGAYRVSAKWGYVRAAGLLRLIKWDDNLDDAFDLSGDATGWGINLSFNLKPTENDVVRLQLVFGQGIQNYMNDSPIDIVSVGLRLELRLMPQPVASPERSNASSRLSSHLIRRSSPAART